MRPTRDSFRADLGWFAAVCRVANGLRNLRIGCHRRAAHRFNTVRYSEKLLEANGITIETIDLSEILGRIQRLKDDHEARADETGADQSVCLDKRIPDASLIKMAKLGAVVDDWMKSNDLAISAVQCWTAMEEYFGVVPCTVMSMMSNELLSSACEVDICGVVSMHALRLASETPSALLDWNNNYGDDPDKAVCFHCSNLPKHFFEDVRMDYQEIIAGTVGKENTFGTCVGKVKRGADELRALLHRRHGRKDSRLCRGRAIHRDPLDTFGGAGVVRDCRLAGPAALHLRERLRAPRGGEFFATAARCTRRRRGTGLGCTGTRERVRHSTHGRHPR